MSLWLVSLGARVTGYSLAPPTTPSLFEVAGIAEDLHSGIGDIRDQQQLHAAIAQARAEIVIHLAAQPLVRESYVQPVLTYATNVMGTVNVLEAVRATPSVRSVLVITSDKCYANRPTDGGYAESDPMGGDDPYSSSKGCAELVAAAYRESYFSAAGVGLATARAGNVIGGGDWARDRIVPDAIAAFVRGESLEIRYPGATRPWQHVLDPVAGYLMLCERLMSAANVYSSGWNFGPDLADAQSVAAFASRIAEHWGDGAQWHPVPGEHPKETQHLQLNCDKAKAQLGWQPTWLLERGLEETVRWYRAWSDKADMRLFTREQIQCYQQEHLR